VSFGISAFIVAGVVCVRTTTAAHIRAKPNAATASTAPSLVKRSPNSHTLRMMLTIGSTITRNGWEARSGPTCSAACVRNRAATLPAARA